MTDSSPTIAVLDRIVDGEHAVLVLEDDADDTRTQLTVAPTALPEEGRHEGAVFEVTVSADDELLEVKYQPATEAARRERAQNRFDRLSERLSDR